MEGTFALFFFPIFVSQYSVVLLLDHMGVDQSFWSKVSLLVTCILI